MFHLRIRFLINLLFYTCASGLPSIIFHVSRSLHIISHDSGLVPPPPPPPAIIPLFQTMRNKHPNKINMKLTYTQRFPDTVYNFIHNCIFLLKLHTYGNQPVTRPVNCFKIFSFDNVLHVYT